jgi:tRNA-2-methylthio-N6-dimethylallyladenosine synthase
MKFYIKTYGCQMNVHDSMRMSNLLKKSSLVETFDIEVADIIVFNTCSVRANAENKVLSSIGKIAKAVKRKNRKEPIIALGGCVGSKDGEELVKKNPFIHVAFGPDQITKLPELLSKYIEKERRLSDTIFVPGDFNYNLSEVESRHENGLTPKGMAYISIAQGCNNFCSYCIVPYTRGREKSRKISDIVKEVEFHLDKEVKEITLLGQNVNSFGGDSNEEFVDLLRAIDATGIKRLRFMTSHPKDISDKCIDAFFELDSLCHFLHLPVQSGSDNVLKKMNRSYDVARYMSIVERLRAQKEDFSFGTDIIVGFPGETEQDFEQTLELVRAVEFETMFSFKYSPRPGTAAAKLEDSVDMQTKERRLATLNRVQQEIRNRKSQTFVGQVADVLVESVSRFHEGHVAGRTPEGRYVNFQADKSHIGKIIKVKITETSDVTYKGIVF